MSVAQTATVLDTDETGRQAPQLGSAHSLGASADATPFISGRLPGNAARTGTDDDKEAHLEATDHNRHPSLDAGISANAILTTLAR